MTDSPHRGPVHQPGHRHWSTHPTSTPSHRPEPPPTRTFSALNSVRRLASASRTYGRCAVDPAGPSLTPTPHRGAPTSRRRNPGKRSTEELPVDRPRSFRNDSCGAGVYVCQVGDVASPFVGV